MSALPAHPFFALALPQGLEWVWISIFFLFGPGSIIFTVPALISCIKNESATDNTKVVWVVIIASFPVLGALGYFLIRRPQRIKELGR